MAFPAFEKVQDPWEMDLVTHLGTLPTLDPVDRLPALSMSIELPEAGDSDLQEAICALKNGDLTATKKTTMKIRNDEDAQSRRLQYCLLQAVHTNNDSVVREVLSRGTTISKDALEAAIRAKALPLLSLFLEFGWNINKPLGSWQPPCLS